MQRWARSVTISRPLQEATPSPILGPCDQPALHWIAMNIPQLFHAFPFAPNRKIVVASLPETMRTDRL